MSSVNEAPTGLPQIVRPPELALEFRVNTHANRDQWSPSVTTLADGGWLVTWMSGDQDGSGWGIYGQRYSSTGAIVGGEFKVNSYTAGSQQDPSVTSLADGGWLVTWSSDGQDGSSYGVYGQRYNNSGATVGSEFQVNTYSDYYQYMSSATSLADGGWVVVWCSTGQDGSYESVHGQRYNSSGGIVGGEFQVNVYSDYWQNFPVVTALSDGGWLVVWQSYSQEGGNFGIYGLRYNSAGVAVGSEFHVNTYTSSEQTNPSVTSLADGGWLITWQSDQEGSGWGIYGQRYNSVGVAVGDEFRANSYTADSQIYPSATALADGGWLITWQSDSQDGSSYGVYGQRYNSSGATVGSEFQVNVYNSGRQREPSVTALPDGGWLIVWQSDNQDGSGDAIYGQRYDAQGSKVSTYTVPTTLATSSDFVENSTLYANADQIFDADRRGTVSWQWQRSGDGGLTWGDIAGATEISYTLDDGDVGKLVRTKGSYTDGEGTVETVYSASSSPVINVNDAPTVTSMNGGATAALNVAENSTAVTTVTATDVDANTTLSYSISGGADASLFQINTVTGALSFKSAPNFEAPADVGVNNIYDVIVQVSQYWISRT